MNKHIAKWFAWGLLAPAVIPFIYIGGLLYPYVAPKTLLFRGLFIVLLAAFVYLVLSRHAFYFERLRNWFAWIPGALLGVAYITSFIGIDFYHSFWSIFDRGDGLLTLTAAVGFFYLVLLYADHGFLRRLFSIAAWVGSAVALYAVFQWLQTISGLDIPIIEEARGRLGATLGNAAFLAAYLGMTFFATLAVVKEYRDAWRQALYAGAALQFLAIILTATRGTILALVALGFLVALYAAWKGEGKSRTYARNGLIAAFILAGLFLGFREQLTQAPFEPVRRIASISVTDATVSSRLFVWENVLGEALKQPLTGYGAEHADVLFNRVYDPAAILEEWFDRSHNSYLDYFVQYGVLGLALYLGIIVALILAGWRLWQGHNDKYGLFVLLIALVYAMQNFFVFDTAMTLWFLLAIFGAVLARNSSATSSAAPFALPPYVAMLAGVVVLSLLYPVVLQPLRANLALSEGYTYHVLDVNRANATMEKGLALNTYADIEYGYQAYVMYTEHQQTMLEGEERVAGYRYALETLKKNYERYPYDARTATYLAHVLDSAPPEEVVDEAFLREIVAKAEEQSLLRAQAQYILANISLKKGDKATGAVRNQHYREALQVLEAYAARVPNLAEPRYVIAGLYLVIGDKASATRWAEEGLALYEAHGGKGAPNKAVKYYIAVEDWPNALRFLQELISEDSDDYEQLYDLAKLYYLNEDRESALRIYERLKREAPDLVASDPAFVRAIESIE